MSTTRELERAPARAPTERTGVLAGETPPAPIPVPSSPDVQPRKQTAMRERWRRGELVSSSTPEAGEFSVPPVTPLHVDDGSPRVVRLPVRPGLRVSYWFRGDALMCEGILLDEQGHTVWHSVIDVDSNPSVAPLFSHFASLITAEIKASGASIELPANKDP